jgi:hypothetical protein
VVTQGVLRVFFVLDKPLWKWYCNSMIKTMNKWTVYWRTGQREVLDGNTQADALNGAGYGRGAVAAIDFIAAGDCHDYTWDATTRDWKWTITPTEKD